MLLDMSNHQLLTLLQCAPKFRVNPNQILLRKILDKVAREDVPEFMHVHRYHWDLVRNVPIMLLNPTSRKMYELDTDAEDEDDIQQNLDRYADLVLQLIVKSNAIWPILVDEHGLILDGYHRLAVLSDHGSTHVDVIQIRPRIKYQSK
jgi:hypothetical protein